MLIYLVTNYMKADPSDWGHQCFSCGCPAIGQK